MSNLPLLRIEQLQSANIAGEPLYEALTFELEAGERIGIVGPSGVGKTTLLRTVTGLQDAHAGAVTLRGKAPYEWSWPGYRRRVVLVSQRPALSAGSFEDNLRQPFGYAALRDLRFSRERAISLMLRLKLREEQLTQPAGSLSVGRAAAALLDTRPDAGAVGGLPGRADQRAGSRCDSGGGIADCGGIVAARLKPR